jgi:two-component system phosphate regulon response regulator PhoB
MDRPLVLVIDDEPAIRLLCRVNLEAEGMRVCEAGDGASGIEQARSEPPDAILLDVMLPGEDGLLVAERMRRDRLLRDVPILFLTARADLGDGERIRRAGGSGCLTKPFNPLALAETVRGLLAT